MKPYFTVSKVCFLTWVDKHSENQFPSPKPLNKGCVFGHESISHNLSIYEGYSNENSHNTSYQHHLYCKQV